MGYPSRRAGISVHAERVGRAITALADDVPLYVITHSMGGIVLRAALAGGWVAPERIGRAVMLAPPNGGSELADLLCHTPLFRLALGPAGQELRTTPDGIAGALPALPCEVGIIAGAASRRTLAVSLFGGPNDGKVSVARAQVDGMRDLLIVPRGHTFIMNAPEVIAQTFHFLEHGAFERPGGELGESHTAGAGSSPPTRNTFLSNVNTSRPK